MLALVNFWRGSFSTEDYSSPESDSSTLWGYEEIPPWQPRHDSSGSGSSPNSSSLGLPDRQLLSNAPALVDLFVEDKKLYLQQVACKIIKTRMTFLRNCAKIDREIEEMTEKISTALKKRKEELKAQLVEIEQIKLTEWDRQMSICAAAMSWLFGIDDVFSGVSELQEYYNQKYTSEINFMENGDIQFEVNDAVLNAMQTTGKIHCGGLPAIQPVNLNDITPKFTIGRSGSGPGEFCRPWGVCADPTGRILVSDRSNNRIQVFNESGKFLLQFGKEGTKPGEFSRPAGIAVDQKCRIIVADKDNHRIQVFTYSGGFLYSFGKLGSNDGEFNYPWDVAVNSNCEIAVGDSKNYRVQLFDSHGTFIQKYVFGRARPGARDIDCPRGLAFWPDGTLLVADFNSHRIVALSRTFTRVSVFGKKGNNRGEFYRPQGLACDDCRRFAVADCKNYRIQVFDVKGNLLKMFGTPGSDVGQFDCPQGVCFHPNGSIIVVDMGNDRIQVF